MSDGLGAAVVQDDRVNNSVTKPAQPGMDRRYSLMLNRMEIVDQQNAENVIGENWKGAGSGAANSKEQKAVTEEARAEAKP